MTAAEEKGLVKRGKDYVMKRRRYCFCLGLMYDGPQR